MLLSIHEAQVISKDAHQGQRDKLDRDYFLSHVCPVANRALAAYNSNLFSKFRENVSYREVYITALFHDMVEDTFYTIDDLRIMQLEDSIVDAVDAITRREDETYFEYLDRALQNNIATIVKYADNAYNISGNPKLSEVLGTEKASSMLHGRYLPARKKILEKVRNFSKN